MQVIKAEVLGMCFGVRDALQILAEVRQPENVTIHGELVHNEEILARLHARGFRMIQESRRRSRSGDPCAARTRFVLREAPSSMAYCPARGSRR